MKSIFKLMPVCALLIFLSSCKSQKAASDVTQQPPAVEQEEVVVPEPEPEVKKPEDTRGTPSTALDARLSNYFSQIAGASSVTAANNNIREALGLFTSGEVPVLIIFYQANGTEDYDEPTTIAKYLNYLKDQGKNPHKVKEVVTDSQGKVKELVLVKK